MEQRTKQEWNNCLGKSATVALDMLVVSGCPDIWPSTYALCMRIKTVYLGIPYDTPLLIFVA